MAAKYSETITTRAGTVLSNVKVQALDSNGVAQTLYTDVGLTTASTPESTAVYSNEEGLAEFYVADGTYTIVHTYRSTTKTFANVELYDLSNLKQLSSDLASTASGKGAALVAGALQVFRVTDYGADPTGATISTTAFQACADAIEAAGGGIFFMPPGTFDIDESVFFPSNTLVIGSGRATVIRAATAYAGVNGGTWATETCQLFKNKNYAASVLTDHDILFKDFHIDWNGVSVVGGGAHSIAIRYAERVTIQNITQEGGENVTAIQACDNVKTENCYSHNPLNCPYDHWEGTTDAWVLNNKVVVDPGEYCVQAIQFTGTSSHETNEGHTRDCWAIGNKVIGIRSALGTAAAINSNAGADGVSSVRRVRTISNHIKDCDSGWMAVGDSGEHSSSDDTFEEVDGVVYGLIADAYSGPPNDVTIDSPTLKDCDHSVSATALLSIAGDGHIVSGLKVINSGAAAYTRIVTLTAAATNCKVTIDKAPDGSGGLRFSNSGTNCKIFDAVNDAFLATHSGAQTFNSASLTDVAFDTESYDENSSFASNIFTAKAGGVYRFEYSLLHDNTGTAGDRWQITITTTPKTFARSYKMIADYDSVSGHALVKLTSGQTAKIRIQRVGGTGNFVTTTDPNSTWFSGARVV